MWARRFYHRATAARGLRVFILTHEEQATQNLFEMVERFHDHCRRRCSPRPASANAKELYFDALDSGYKVGTAGTKGVGRSATIQLFHGSEVAFWPHAETHAAGVLQAVPDEPGTEMHPGEHRQRRRQFVSPDVARRRDRRATTTSRSSCPGTGRRNTASRSPAGFRARRRRSATTRRSTGSTTSRWRGGAARSPSCKDPTLFKQEYPANAAEAFQMIGPRQLHPAGADRPRAQGAVRAVRPAGHRLRSGLDRRRPPRHGVAARPPRPQGREPHAARHHAGGRLAQAGDRRGQAGARVHRRRRRRRRRLRPAAATWGEPYAAIVRAGEFRLGAVRAAAARRARPAVGRPAQPPRRDVDEVEGMARGSGRRADPG